jgi:hypothetical protein
MQHIPDPDSSSEEDSISITSTPEDRNFFYEEDMFEESQDETALMQPIYLEESISESMEYAEDELESMSKETFPFNSESKKIDNPKIS